MPLPDGEILPGLERRVVDIPPATETRLIQDEVVVQIATNVTPDRLQAAVRRLGLTVIASESLANAGSTVVRLKITNGRTPAAAIESMRNVGMAAIVQPNYVYALDQAGARRRRRGAIRPSSRATPRSTSSRSSRCWTFTAWSGAPMSRSR